MQTATGSLALISNQHAYDASVSVNAPSDREKGKLQERKFLPQGRYDPSNNADSLKADCIALTVALKVVESYETQRFNLCR